MDNIDVQQFKDTHGYELNLENPVTFNEKLQWIKVFGNTENYAKYTDKYTVREFIKNKIGEKYLVPIIGIYKNVDDIDFESLPQSFVMKATHGSNWNIIVKDKLKINWDRAIKDMSGWINTNFYDITGEPCYKPLQGRIIIEQLIEDSSGDLNDFKFHCFNGSPTFIELHAERFIDHKCGMYDLSWNKLPLKTKSNPLTKEYEKPKHLDEMINLARILSRKFPYVRVDFYYTKDQIYFSELTFIPANGLDPFTPVKYDKLFGDLIDLALYKKDNHS